MEPCVFLWVNHYGWISGGSLQSGLRYSKHRASAKPFPLRQPNNITDETLDYCRNALGCNVDLYKGTALYVPA